MRFARGLVVIEAGADPDPVIALCRALLPDGAIAVLVSVPLGPRFRLRDPLSRVQAIDEAAAPIAARLRAGLGAELHLDFTPELDAAVIREAAERAAAEVLVIGPLPSRWTSRVVAWLDEVQALTQAATLWAQGPGRATPGPWVVLCPVAGDDRAMAAVAGLLRDRSSAADRAIFLASTDVVRLDPPTIRELSGIAAAVEVRRPTPGSQGVAAITQAAQATGAGLILMAPEPKGPLVELLGRSPPVLVPPQPLHLAPAANGRLDAADVAVIGPAIRLRVETPSTIGAPAPYVGPLLCVARGRTLAAVHCLRGEAELELGGPPPAHLGLGRPPADGAGDPLAASERWVAVLAPGAAPMTLFDSRLTVEALRLLRRALPSPERILAAVRLRAGEAILRIRERLHSAGLGEARVVDAATLLDEGEPADVPEAADPVRLCRLGARLRGEGFAVDSVVHLGGRVGGGLGFAVLSAEELPRLPEALAAAARGRLPAVDETPLDRRLRCTTGAPLQGGNDVAIELDNHRARCQLLDAIAAATVRVHLQFYIASDDAVGRAVEAALVGAADRGVEVRVLVDSLYSLHESLGQHNSLLVRLAAARGVEVRAVRPIAGVPSLRDLKARSHRKLCLVDGALALLGGRNLGREYYTGFDEVALGPGSDFREVPWVDLTVALRGPAVASLDDGFLADWTAAGGAPFPIAPPPPMGDVAARVVLHEGLADAYTLEAYLALIATARRRLTIVNTFPLQLEVQRALLGALARGVQVRVLAGNVRPLSAVGPFPGGGALRELANQLVHARFDTLVESGAEVVELVLRGLPAWDPAVGEVRPQVHAKAVSADGAVCAVGSANLDITAGYWESEALLVIEDPRIAGALEAQLEALFTDGARVDRKDPAWLALAGRRAPLSRYWPSILG